MSNAELEIGRTVIRTVRFEFTEEDVAAIVVEHVKRKHRVQLKDFELEAQVVFDAAVPCLVTGEARTDGLALTRKRKARA